MIRWLDRVFTGEVLCRNCPAYRGHDSGIGTCGLDAPTRIALGSHMAPVDVLRVKRAAIDWCAHHPLHFGKKGEGLYYAPGELGDSEVAGFNRPPALHEALQFAPDNAPSRRAARQMRDRLNEAALLNRASNSERNSG